MGRWRRISAISASVLLVAVWILAAAPRARADDNHLLVVGVGAFDIGAFQANNKQTTAFVLEYRAGWNLWDVVHPVIGGLYTAKDSSFFYLGFVLDFKLTEHLYITPGFTPGIYSKGSGRDLGHDLEFRTVVEVSYRFKDATRIGLSFYHMSNADLGKNNPGAETLQLNFAIPLNLF
ncbi:MAG: acyloxyacyl hydrolase [Alphaproteobacteria bacterium]